MSKNNDVIIKKIDLLLELIIKTQECLRSLSDRWAKTPEQKARLQLDIEKLDWVFDRYKAIGDVLNNKEVE